MTQYQGDGRRSSVYAYDWLNQLTDTDIGTFDPGGVQILAPHKRALAWDLDNLGNWVGVDGPSPGFFRDTYDAGGQLANSETVDHDTDLTNQVTEVTVDDGSGGGPETTTIDLRSRSFDEATGLALLKDDQELNGANRALTRALFRRCPDLKFAARLGRRIAEMIRQPQRDDLNLWIDGAQQANEPKSLRSFPSGLTADHAAVRAALVMHWSNGQVEEQVNRLDLIKRLMYGRAKFDLLRLRVL